MYLLEPIAAFHSISCIPSFFQVFMYKWSVNWQFVPEDVFLSKPFALVLLAAHAGALGALAWKFWWVRALIVAQLWLYFLPFFLSSGSHD
jgi:hypothetical protein